MDTKLNTDYIADHNNCLKTASEKTDKILHRYCRKKKTKVRSCWKKCPYFRADKTDGDCSKMC